MLGKKIEDCSNGIFILGITDVNMSLANVISEKKINVYLWDLEDTLVEEYKKNCKNDYIKFLDVNKCDFEKIDYFVLSKDIILGDETKALFFRLEKIKEKVYIDIEFIAELYPNNKYIAILAPDYDFIITSLLKNILKYSHINAIDINGNFDNTKNSSSPFVVNFDDAVCYSGISDRRFEFIKNFKFDILAILDISEETSKNKKLVNQQKYLVSLQKETSKIILNMDNKYIKNFYNEIVNDSNLTCKIIPISVSKILNNGISYVNNTIYNYYNDNNSYDIKENDQLKGDVNKLAELTSFIIAGDYKVSGSVILETLNNFCGIKNCLEYVSQYNNIKFINNVGAVNKTILTTPFATYDNIYAIFIINEKQINGGFNRKEQNSRKNIKKIYLVDYTGLVNDDNIDNKKVFKFNNLKDAVNKAIEDINKNEEKEHIINVLLSPIVADPDNIVEYDDYGIEYKNIIAGLNKEENN